MSLCKDDAWPWDTGCKSKFNSIFFLSSIVVKIFGGGVVFKPMVVSWRLTIPSKLWKHKRRKYCSLQSSVKSRFFKTPERAQPEQRVCKASYFQITSCPIHRWDNITVIMNVNMMMNCYVCAGRVWELCKCIAWHAGRTSDWEQWWDLSIDTSLESTQLSCLPNIYNQAMHNQLTISTHWTRIARWQKEPSVVYPHTKQCVFNF